MNASSTETQKIIAKSNVFREEWKENESINYLKSEYYKDQANEELCIDLSDALLALWELELNSILLSNFVFESGSNYSYAITHKLSANSKRWLKNSSVVTFDNRISSRYNAYTLIWKEVKKQKRKKNIKNIIILDTELDHLSFQYGWETISLPEWFVFKNQWMQIEFEIEITDYYIWQYFLWSLYVVPFDETSNDKVIHFIEKYKLHISKSWNTILSDKAKQSYQKLVVRSYKEAKYVSKPQWRDVLITEYKDLQQWMIEIE